MRARPFFENKNRDRSRFSPLRRSGGDGETGGGVLLAHVEFDERRSVEIQDQRRSSTTHFESSTRRGICSPRTRPEGLPPCQARLRMPESIPTSLWLPIGTMRATRRLRTLTVTV